MEARKLKNAAVLHINSAKATATSPTMRIARFTADNLGIPLIHSVESADRYKDTRFDHLFVKLGLLKFSNHRDQALRIYERARNIINLENDYAFKPDPRLRKINPSWRVWGTVPANVADGGAYLNWNMLTWLYGTELDGWEQKIPITESIEHALMYYGACREDRHEDFKEYLLNRMYTVRIATHIPGRKKWSALAGEPLDYVTFKSPLELKRYQATIYIEDAFSNGTFCSLANRFYECLQLGIPMFIDKKALNSFEAAELHVRSGYVVEDSGELWTKLRKGLSWATAMAQAQRRDWYVDHTSQLKLALRQAAANL